MKKLIILLLLLNTTIAFAQTDPFDTYIDFNQAIVSNNPASALALSKSILSDIEKLKPATRLAFYAKLAKVYQDTGDDANALLYFLKVIAAQPDYYVPHWAVANIYLEQSNSLAQKMNAAKNDKAQYDRYFAEYKALMYKTLGHLEKTQACDPSPETMTLIRDLYKRFKDTGSLQSLDDRLKQLAANCITILPDL